jgi:KDO2-lipid IV(A) lauroyltransferase
MSGKANMFGFSEARIRRVVTFIEYRVFYPLIALLPRTLAYKAASFKGILAGRFCEKTLANCEQGLNQCFVDNTQHNRAVAVAQLRMLAREKLDVYLIPKMTQSNIEDYIKFVGLEYYVEAKKTGRPIILYTAHFGRLIMPLIALGLLGYDTSPLTAPLQGTKSELWYLQKKLKVMHSAMKGTFVNTNESMRSLYKVLSNGETLIVLVDVPPVPGQAYYEVDFLGGVAKFPKGIVRLANKLDALLVPYFTMEDQGYLCGEFLPAIETKGLQNEELVAKLLIPIEEKIQQYPEQWWMWPWIFAFWTKR